MTYYYSLPTTYYSLQDVLNFLQLLILVLLGFTGIYMACAWYMHGICMAYAWHVHGICMVYAAHPPPAPRLHRCAHDPLRHRHILPASRARLGLSTAHGARLVLQLGAQDPHNSNPNPNPNPNPKP